MSLNVCRCCMARPPDKHLKAQYTRRGKTVVYGDMLKECFEIQIFLNESDDGGICELCEMKLADANEFKLQVQKCQRELQKLLTAAPVKVETKASIKQEADDDDDDDDEEEDNEIYFLDVKEESDFEMRDDADDDKNLAELFPESAKKEKKKTTVLKKKNDNNKTGESSSGINKTQLTKPTVTHSSSKVRSNIDKIMKYSNATPFLNKTGIGIICSFCIKTFKDISVLKTHINDAHKDEMVTNYKKIDRYSTCIKVDISNLKCKICDKNFDIISNLKKHLIKDHNIKFHNDVNDYFCEFKLTTDKFINCAICNSKFNSFVVLVQHMHSHYNNYTCEKCDVGFINNQALKLHEKRHLNVRPDSKDELKAKSEITDMKSEVSNVKLKAESESTEVKSRDLKCVQSGSETAKIRRNIKNVLKYSNCTPFSNKSVTGITCAFCDIKVNNIADMKTHMTQVHKEVNLDKVKYINSLVFKIDITDLACNICNANVNFISDLKEHLSKEHAIAFFSDVNDYFVEFKLTANEHFTCVFCNSNYETFKSMLQHLRSEHYKNYFCEVCGASFLNRFSQKMHTKNVHGTGTHKCSVCNKEFSNKPAQIMHEKVVHKKEARFKSKCPFCNAIFNHYYKRNQHLFKEHNAKSAIYNCNVCDKTFFLKSQLTRHTRKEHLKERNAVCSYCGDRFFDKARLKDHLAVHERDKIYQCGICSKAYSRKKILSAHMKVHN